MKLPSEEQSKLPSSSTPPLSETTGTSDSSFEEEPLFLIENRVEYITIEVDPNQIEPEPNEIDSIEFEHEYDDFDDEQECQVYYELEGDLDALDLLDRQTLEQLGISDINLNVSLSFRWINTDPTNTKTISMDNSCSIEKFRKFLKFFHDH